MAASHTTLQTAPPAAGYIPSLDGIRALSFLIVFAAHAGLERWIPGFFGLSVFFFLSGYLITTLLRVEWNRTGTVNLRQFYLRRALRILPPFYVVLAGASALTLFGALDGSLQGSAVLMGPYAWPTKALPPKAWLENWWACRSAMPFAGALQ